LHKPAGGRGPVLPETNKRGRRNPRQPIKINSIFLLNLQLSFTVFCQGGARRPLPRWVSRHASKAFPTVGEVGVLVLCIAAYLALRRAGPSVSPSPPAVRQTAWPTQQLSWMDMDLRIISMFENLAPDALDRIEKQCSLRTFEKDAEIFGEQETTTDVFFVLAGTVRVTSFTSVGKEVIYSDIPAGNIFGEFSAIDQLPRSTSVVALTDCTLARMSSAAFFAVLRENSDVCVHLVQLLVAKMRSMSERVFEVSALAVRERLRRELLRLALASGKPDQQGVIIRPAPTHYEIAARIGSHREAVTREMNRLEQEKLVETGRRSIRITDLRKLRKGLQ
jgi:CRP-like cAMP-binding protein